MGSKFIPDSSARKQESILIFRSNNNVKMDPRLTSSAVERREDDNII